MKNKKLVLGLVALVACLVICAALMVPTVGGRPLLWSFAALVGVTVTYAYPVSGTTAPTAIQSKRKNMLTATVAMSDSETTATVTHNWGLDTAELADRFPLITHNYVTPGTAATVLSFSRSTNAVTITKATGAGSGSTFEINLERPHTIIR